MIDFLVAEAVYAKANQEEKEAVKKQGVEDWKSGHDDLRRKLS